MGRVNTAPAQSDDRGVIVDLLLHKSIDAITYLTLAESAIRGNHFHAQTTQWTFVTAGRISYAEAQQGGEAEHFVGSTGDLFISEPGVVHAVRAEMDSSIIVFTAGPRAGASYEDDTFRVSTPLF